MSDSLLNRIKKFIERVEESSTSKEIQSVDNENETNKTESELNRNTLPVEDNEKNNSQKSSLTFVVDEKISNNLKSILDDDINLVAGFIIDKQDLSVKAFYNKSDKIDQYIQLLIENIIKMAVDNSFYNNVEKILIVGEDNTQYLMTDSNNLIILITTQTNQVITWKLIEKIQAQVFI